MSKQKLGHKHDEENSHLDMNELDVQTSNSGQGNSLA